MYRVLPPKRIPDISYQKEQDKDNLIFLQVEKDLEESFQE